MDGFFSEDIVNKLDPHHIKLFNNHFHLKMNDVKSAGPIFHEISHLSDKIMNEFSKD